MGTIDKIIDGLNASKTDKITKLNKRFDENKSWMTKEFEQLRGLIGPRGAKGGVVKQASVSEVAKVPSSSSSAGSTSSSRRAVTAAAPAQPVVAALAPVPKQEIVKEEVKKNKRKSPEEALNSEKLSPEYKRNSSDFEKIVLAAGLPADLNRLKKDNLLKELPSRGHTELTMKSLKKDMVEALRYVLLEQGRASPEKLDSDDKLQEHEVAQPQSSTSSQSLRALTKESPPSKPMAVAEPASVRKASSTMSDIRKELTASGSFTAGQLSQATESEEDRKKRLEGEFKRRHSNAQARKSEGKAGEAGESPRHEALSPEPAPATVAAAATPPATSTTSGAPALTKPDRDSDIMFSEDGSTWMEVASPQPVHSLANLRTNIAKEVATGDNINPSTPGGGKSIFIKAEKGVAAPQQLENTASTTTTTAASNEIAVPSTTTSGIAASMTKTDPHSGKQVPSYNVPSTPSDKGATSGSASAVKSSAKKGLFSFLSAKVKEEKQEAPLHSAAHASAIKAEKIAPADSLSHSHSASSAIKQDPYASTSGQENIKPTAPSVPAKTSKSPHQQQADEYKIDDRDEASDSGTDDEDDNKSKQNKVPEWARGVSLKEQLERQYGLHGHKSVDPDLIFPEVQTCSLEEIFGASVGKSGSYNKRSSSAHWEHDEITLVEKRTYRSQMGLSN